MKFIILLLFSFPLFASKNLPLKVNHKIEKEKLSIKLMGQDKIENFTIRSVRGIDGLKTEGIAPISKSTLEKGDEVAFTVEYTAPETLSYVIVDMEGVVRNQKKNQSLAIAVGDTNKNVKEKKTPFPKERRFPLRTR